MKKHFFLFLDLLEVTKLTSKNTFLAIIFPCCLGCLSALLQAWPMEENGNIKAADSSQQATDEYKKRAKQQYESNFSNEEIIAVTETEDENVEQIQLDNRQEEESQKGPFDFKKVLINNEREIARAKGVIESHQDLEQLRAEVEEVFISYKNKTQNKSERTIRQALAEDSIEAARTAWNAAQQVTLEARLLRSNLLALLPEGQDRVMAVDINRYNQPKIKWREAAIAYDLAMISAEKAMYSESKIEELKGLLNEAQVYAAEWTAMVRYKEARRLALKAEHPTVFKETITKDMIKDSWIQALHAEQEAVLKKKKIDMRFDGHSMKIGEIEEIIKKIEEDKKITQTEKISLLAPSLVFIKDKKNDSNWVFLKEDL